MAARPRALPPLTRERYRLTAALVTLAALLAGLMLCALLLLIGLRSRLRLSALLLLAWLLSALLRIARILFVCHRDVLRF
jgi:hypothetical protein